jgi:hypothetical protein
MAINRRHCHGIRLQSSCLGSGGKCKGLISPVDKLSTRYFCIPCVGIRTLLMQGKNRASEFQESMNKAQALLRAVKMARSTRHLLNIKLISHVRLRSIPSLLAPPAFRPCC